MTIFFFFNDTATTEIYTLSLHDALPISGDGRTGCAADMAGGRPHAGRLRGGRIYCCRAGVFCLRLVFSPASHKSFVAEILDRKSTRLNSSHGYISYAVFCLKKKKK